VQKVDTEFAKNLMFRRRKSLEIGRPFGSEPNVCEVQPPLSKRLKGKQRHDAFSAALCSILASCELEPLRHRTILAITRIATQPSDRLASPSAQAPATRQLASLTSTCRRHQIDPQLYLTQLLMNLPQTKLSELDAWLPDHWKLHQAARTEALNRAASVAP